MNKVGSQDLWEKLADRLLVQQALRRAARNAILTHAHASRPIAIWHDGKVVWIQPNEILAQFDEMTDQERSERMLESERGENPMTQDSQDRPSKRWTAGELRKLPPEQRDAIMEAAAAQAEGDYRNDPSLTAFEAFGKEDLYGDSANAETR